MSILATSAATGCNIFTAGGGHSHISINWYNNKSLLGLDHPYMQLSHANHTVNYARIHRGMTLEEVSSGNGGLTIQIRQQTLLLVIN